MQKDIAPTGTASTALLPSSVGEVPVDVGASESAEESL